MDLTLILFIIGWVLIFLFVIGIGLIAFYSQRIDKCRTWKTLYCRAGQSDGWRCTNIEGSTNITTLADTLADVKNKTELVPCPSSDDTGIGTSKVYASYVLKPNPDPAIFCDTTRPDAENPIGCRTGGVLGALLNFPGDPLINDDQKVTPLDVFNWYCRADLPKNSDLSAKRAAWKAFIKQNVDFQVSQPIQFTGQAQP